MVIIHRYADTYSRKTAIQVHKDSKSKEIDLKNIFFRVFQEGPLGNAVRKLHAKFH